MALAPLDVRHCPKLQSSASCKLQYQGKLIMQPWENDKNPNFGPNFGAPNFFKGFFSTSSVPMFQNNVQSYKPMPFPGKLMNQTSKNDKKPSFWPDFGPFWWHLGSKKFFCGFYLIHCCKPLLYVISRKTNKTN